MACSVSSLDWARIHCANPGRFSDSQYAAIERYWYAENSSFLIWSFIASSTALPSKVISSFSSFALSLPPLYRSPRLEASSDRRLACPQDGQRKSSPSREGDYTAPVLSPGYVRLLTLEWAKEVAKAARGTTSVARSDPPAQTPPVCWSVTDPATSAPPSTTTPSR